MRLRGGLQGRQDGTGLHPGGTSIRIDLNDLIEVTREVENDSCADSVARNGGAATARGDRDASFAAHRQRCEYIVGIAREHDHLRHNTVIGSITREFSAATSTVVDLAADNRAQGVNDFAAIMQ
ncbi:hypothetical protein A20C1_05216 [marine actinobacterium PHSC20C1]|nr:hypothetical protein A20C1_05216 [marine actinobacterium PHSC20C1]